jgi:hypothetical protein
MIKLSQNLVLTRCPHCGIDQPNLTLSWGTQTVDSVSKHVRFWNVYVCARCGALVTAASSQDGGEVTEIYPASRTVDEELPPIARTYLEQAIASMHAPAGAVMLAASSVDAMLKAKGLSAGTLYSRINSAADSHLVTSDMAQWAHEIRLDANDQRHADPSAALPTPEDARRCLDFAVALGQFLFVLPARVARGRAELTVRPLPAT